MASRHRQREVRKDVLENSKPKSYQPEQKAKDRLVELVRQAIKDPLPQKPRGKADEVDGGLFGAEDVLRSHATLGPTSTASMSSCLPGIPS